MSERYLSWTSISSSSDDRCFTGSMMYYSKWSIYNEGDISREESGYGIYFWEFNLFFEFHIRKYSCHSFCEHSFSTSWWSLHENIMTSSCCNEKSTFGMFLSYYIRKIRWIFFFFIFFSFCFFGSRWNRGIASKNIDNVTETGYANNIDIWNYRCLKCVIYWEKYSFHSEFSRKNRCRKSSTYWPYDTIERQFSEK